jgi:NAD(P)-dependent dehydrogenase (short-subunit alcohol dehydrogenase family)
MSDSIDPSPVPSGTGWIRSQPHRLRGRVALVTGATSGIGLTIAQRLSAEGAQLVITGRSRERGERVAADLGPRVRFIAADLTDEDAPRLLVDFAIAQFGTLDILVNNAAVDHVGDFLTTPMSEIRETFETNTFATIALIQAAGLAMRDSGGSIVNITSRLASIGVPTMGIYSAAKGAILSLTRAAAIELAPYRIRVNAVAPGMTKTPLYDAWLSGQGDPAAVEEATIGKIPLHRLAIPADVAAAVAYLASDDAAYLTGTSIPVDGGYTAQ